MRSKEGKKVLSRQKADRYLQTQRNQTETSMVGRSTDRSNLSHIVKRRKKVSVTPIKIPAYRQRPGFNLNTKIGEPGQRPNVTILSTSSLRRQDETQLSVTNRSLKHKSSSMMVNHHHPPAEEIVD